MISEQDFRKLADDELKAISRALDAYTELTVDYANETVTLEFDDGDRFVLNEQGAARPPRRCTPAAPPRGDRPGRDPPRRRRPSRTRAGDRSCRPRPSSPCRRRPPARRNPAPRAAAPGGRACSWSPAGRDPAPRRPR